MSVCWVNPREAPRWPEDWSDYCVCQLGVRSNEILHTDWASWLSSTVGIPYTVRSCACFDEQRMAVRRSFTWKRAERVPRAASVDG